MSIKSCNKDTPFPPVKDSTLRVYSMRFCPYAKRTLLALEHKKIPYEVVNINLKSKPDWFLERNPLGLVPTLEKDGKVVYESTAATEWVDDVYPEVRLTPSDPFVKAQDRMLLEYFGKFTPNLYKLRSVDTREEGLTQLAIHAKHYESALAKREGPFFGGASPSLLDFYLFPFFELITISTTALGESSCVVSEAECPALTKWYGLLTDLPANKNLQHPKETFVQYLQSSIAGSPNYDINL